MFAGGEGGEGGKGGGGTGGGSAVVLGAATGDGGLGGGGGGEGGHDGDGGGKGGGEGDGGDGDDSSSAPVETVLATGKHNRRSARQRTNRTAGARGLPRLCMGRTPRRGFPRGKGSTKREFAHYRDRTDDISVISIRLSN